MKVNRIAKLKPIEIKRDIKLKPKPNVLPWMACPKCGAQLSKELHSKEVIEKSGCRCRGTKIVVKYKYSCASCGHTEIRT